MLGKLIKYEFRSTYKALLLCFASVIAATVLFIVSSNSFDTEEQYYAFRIMLTGIALVVGIFGAGICAFMYLIKRFYDSMYSQQGYLTLTLPADKLIILNSKLLVTYIWYSAFVILLSICIFLYSCTMGDVSFFEQIQDNINTIRENLTSSDVLMALLSVVFRGLHYILFIFAAISLGQLSVKNKVGAAVGYAILLHIVESMLSALCLVVVALVVHDPVSLYTSFIGTGYALAPSIILLLLQCIAEYLICAYIVKNKVNLQ